MEFAYYAILTATNITIYIVYHQTNISVSLHRVLITRKNTTAGCGIIYHFNT